MIDVGVNAVRLRYLHAVAATGSMRAASDRLRVSPSSVSRQISKLESELGLLMLEKGRRKVVLTEAGELAVRFYRQQQSDEEAFLSEIAEMRGLRHGTVTLAVGEGFVGEPFSNLLHAFIDQYPGIRVKINLGATSQVLRMVAEDEVHAGLALEAPADPMIRVRKTVPQPIRAVMAPGNPLSRARSLTLANLTDCRLALPQRDFRIRQLIAEAEQEDGVFLTPVITSNSLLVLKNFARSTDGITLMPDLALTAELETGLLHSVPIDSQALARCRVQLILRARRQLPASAMRVLRFLEGYMQDRCVGEG